MTITPLLRGRTIIVIEDEPLIAMDVAGSLEDEGATVEGPYRSSDDALVAVNDREANDTIDAAVLDIHLGKETCEPFARRLKELNIPFVLHSGNWQVAAALIEELDVAVVRKPALPETLIAAVERCLTRSDRSG